MFIAAHPDDTEGGAGGTISLLKKNGIKVVYLIVTNGDKGCA
jgi:LmbE family N-acetylglucosaminyl deacetylase